MITQVVAIGPRFVYKYIQTNYFPIDNNIIREAAYVGGGHEIFLDEERVDKEDLAFDKPATAPSVQIPNAGSHISITSSPNADSSKILSNNGLFTPALLTSAGQPMEMTELQHQSSMVPQSQGHSQPRVQMYPA